MDQSAFQGHCDVQEVDSAWGPVCSELDGRVGVVEVVEEGLKLGRTMQPDGKDVINIAPPDQWLQWVR